MEQITVSTATQEINIDNLQASCQSGMDEVVEIGGQLLLMSKVLVNVELDSDDLGSVSDMLFSLANRLTTATVTIDDSTSGILSMARLAKTA